MAGVRVHDYTRSAWKQDLDIIVGGAGDVVAYITFPKPTAARQVARAMAAVAAFSHDSVLVPMSSMTL